MQERRWRKEREPGDPRRGLVRWLEQVNSREVFGGHG
jgi:hypothetical protein